MKKETLAWQLIILVLGIFFLLIIKTYLEDKIIVEVMNNDAETMSKRANCYAVAEEKGLNQGYCEQIDTSISINKFFGDML